MRKTTFTVLLSLLVMAVFSARATAVDIQAGRALHDKHCLKCHDTSVYSRDRGNIISLAALRTRVSRCELSQGLKLPADATENIVQYLNKSFYGFE
jgi:cytochrome c553